MKILIIDDHVMLLESLKFMLEAESYHVEIASKAETAITLVTQNHYELVLLDHGIPDLNSEIILKIIKSSSDAPPTLILSGNDCATIPHNMKKHGANGFIHKSAPPEKLLTAITTVIQGGSWWPNTIDEAVDNNNDATVTLLAKQNGITTRQLQVLKHIAGGMSNKQISHELDISISTVKSHISSLFETMSVNNRVECLRKTRELGIID